MSYESNPAPTSAGAKGKELHGFLMRGTYVPVSRDAPARRLEGVNLFHQFRKVLQIIWLIDIFICHE